MTMLDWDNPLETQTHNKTDVDSALVSNTLSRAASYKEVQTPSEEQNLKHWKIKSRLKRRKWGMQGN